MPLQAYNLLTLQVCWIDTVGSTTFAYVIYTLPKALHLLVTPPPKSIEYTIDSFDFRFRSRGAFERYAYFSTYVISYDGVTLTFHLVIVDSTVDCVPRACINFVDFIWDKIKTFAFIKFIIVCVPFDTPTITFLLHYRSANDCWRKYKLWATCCRDSTPSVRQFGDKCTFRNSYSTYQNSCIYTICLLQQSTLRNLASHSDFHHTFNSSEFQDTGRTFHQLVHTAISQLVAEDKLKSQEGVVHYGALMCNIW